MNKNTHLALWAVVGLVCCFSACGGDDDEAAGIQELALADTATVLRQTRDCERVRITEIEEDLRKNLGKERLTTDDRVDALLKFESTCQAFTHCNTKNGTTICELSCDAIAKTSDQEERCVRSNFCKWNVECTKYKKDVWGNRKGCKKHKKTCVEK